MYRSYSFNNMPQPINPTPEKPESSTVVNKHAKKEETVLRKPFKTDDLVLLLVIAVLILNNCDDKLLLLALLYVFLSDYLNG